MCGKRNGKYDSSQYISSWEYSATMIDEWASSQAAIRQSCLAWRGQIYSEINCSWTFLYVTMYLVIVHCLQPTLLGVSCTANFLWESRGTGKTENFLSGCLFFPVFTETGAPITPSSRLVRVVYAQWCVYFVNKTRFTLCLSCASFYSTLVVTWRERSIYEWGFVKCRTPVERRNKSTIIERVWLSHKGGYDENVLGILSIPFQVDSRSLILLFSSLPQGVNRSLNMDCGVTASNITWTQVHSLEESHRSGCCHQWRICDLFPDFVEIWRQGK